MSGLQILMVCFPSRLCLVWGSIELCCAWEGQHSILLQVEDSSGQITDDMVVITVGPPNSVPECLITSPSSSSSFEEEEFITFSGIATDDDVDNRTLNITWSSDIDGVFDTTSPSIDGDLGFLFQVSAMESTSLPLMLQMRLVHPVRQQHLFLWDLLVVKPEMRNLSILAMVFQ